MGDDADDRPGRRREGQAKGLAAVWRTNGRAAARPEGDDHLSRRAPLAEAGEDQAVVPDGSEARPAP